MSMQLTTHQHGDIVTVEVRGKLTLGDATAALREKIWELLREGSRQILLDMSGVTYIDSSGIGELVAAYSNVAAAGGEMKLVNLAKRVHDLLTITKLYSVFETYEDEGLARASFSIPKGRGQQPSAAVRP